MKEITLYPSRVKSSLLLLIMVLFTIVGVWMIIESGSWKGWFVSLFSILGTFVALVNLLPGRSYLKLTATGFEYSSLARKHFLKWSDIESFGVTMISLNKMVVFNYSASYTKSKKGRSLSKGIAGWEGGLHDTFGMKAEKLMNLMNAYWIAARNTYY